jgi:hypothetical protein
MKNSLLPRLGGALFAALTLSACTQLADGSPFAANQTWLIIAPSTTLAGEAQRVSVQTHKLLGYIQGPTLLGDGVRPAPALASSGPVTSAPADNRVYSSLNPALLTRLLALPGAEPMLLYTPADHAALFAWYGAGAGEPYLCRLSVAGPLQPGAVLEGQLLRLVKGQGQPLGECSARLESPGQR